MSTAAVAFEVPSILTGRFSGLEANIANTPKTAPAGPVRLCTECELPIPTARLRAMPNARQCVKCLEFLGDVPRVKHYHEQTSDGETVTTAYTDRQIITHLTQQDIRQAEEFLEEATEGSTLLFRLDKQEAHLHEVAREQTVSEFEENFQITDVMHTSEEEADEHIGD